MPQDSRERGVTNLGPVPDGMSFLDATKALELKHKINPSHHSKRLTICETSREIWRIADLIGGRRGDDLKALAAASFNFGKSMNNRMVYLREKLDEAGVDF